MLTSNRYLKIIEWSETDQCYVGSCPTLMYGGCHGQDEKQVFEQLCLRVNEIMKLKTSRFLNLYPFIPCMGWRLD